MIQKTEVHKSDWKRFKRNNWRENGKRSTEVREKRNLLKLCDGTNYLH